MTPVEAAKVIALVSAYFPNARLPEPTVKAWADQLTSYEYQDAAAAVGHLAERVSYPTPSLADLIELIREIRHLRLPAHAALPEPGPASDVDAKAHIARIRKMLGDVGRDMP